MGWLAIALLAPGVKIESLLRTLASIGACTYTSTECNNLACVYATKEKMVINQDE